MNMNDNTHTVPIEDLNTFVRNLTGWHTRQLAKVNHLQQVPENSVFQVEGNSEVVMTSEVLAGFKLGIELVLAELGTLPFAVEYDAPAETKVLETEDAAG